MTITNTLRWNGKLGSAWGADVPNPPGPDKTNWDLISGPGTSQNIPSGAGDLAVIDLSGAITITAPHPASAEEMQIVNASIVTFSDGHFQAGADGDLGGMLVDESAELIIASSATMTNQGSLDIIGLTSDGTLTVQPGAGFDDHGMIVGADSAAVGLVTVDSAIGFEIVQSTTGASDGVLVVGEDGTGTVDVSNSLFFSATAILGKNAGSTGKLVLSNSTWGGSDLTVGQSGTANATIEAASNVAFSTLVVGDATGSDSVDVSGGSVFGTNIVTLGKNAGATGNVTVNGATWNGATLTVGLAGTGSATIQSGSTVQFADLLIGRAGSAVPDSMDVSGGSELDTSSAILGDAAGATGSLTLDASNWTGNDLTVGASGTGDATIKAGSTVSFTDLVIGQGGTDSAGSLDASGSSLLNTKTVTLGEGAGAVGDATLSSSIWSGDSLTVGQSGTGSATIEAGSAASFSNILVGPDGLVDVTGALGTAGTVTALHLTLQFGTLDVTGGGEVLVGPVTGHGGTISVGGAAVPLIGLGTMNGDVALDNQGTVQATGPTPGSLTIHGNISGTGTLAPLMTLEVNGGIGSGVNIAFGTSTAAEVGDLVLDVPAANLGTIVGFGAGNTIDVQGSLYTNALFTQGTSGAAGTLTLSGGTSAPLSMAVLGDYSADSFVATAGTTDTIVTLCFVAGTHIATPHGEVPVEQLAIGDEVLTLSGATRPVTWIGEGHVLATRGQRNAATPVIVRRGALADNVPHRDLHITKGHSLFIDGVLIPVEELINHRSIIWDDRAQQVSIYHIELDAHDVLLADGAPAESYRDDGNRWLFQNANTAWALAPQPPCAPVVNTGPVVDAIWRRLLERDGPRHGVPLTEEPDLHLVADGRRIDPAWHYGSVRVFPLSAPRTAVHVVSRAAVPAELGVKRDARCLGVALWRMVLRHGPRFRTIEASDKRLVVGFHDYEPAEGLRWTDGDAALPAELFDGLSGPIELMLHVGGTAQYIAEATEQAA